MQETYKYITGKKIVSPFDMISVCPDIFFCVEMCNKYTVLRFDRLADVWDLLALVGRVFFQEINQCRMC